MLDERLAPLTEKIIAHKKLGLGKDKDMRFRWDLFSFSGIRLGDGKGMSGDIDLYAYMNDLHIDTALKAYVDARPNFNA